MSDREKVAMLVMGSPLKKADATVLLEGDGLYRVAEAAALYHSNLAPKIVVSGNSDNRAYGSFPGGELKKQLQMKHHVPGKDIILEEQSLNTRDQAVNVVALAQEKKWKKLLLVASPHHQLRAFLTFLKVVIAARSRLEIINAPARSLSWFAKLPWGRRIDLLEGEYARIHAYQQAGHVASWSQALAYFEKQEKKK